MSTKTPEENESDMEAGMTTAERRRRRRRGGGLRVPSDNVPRRISSPAVAPMSEDPSVAIAYTGSGSEAPVLVADPVAPEPINTFIDPPADQVIEEINFDSKTREMSVVDLEELGLDAEAQLQARTVSTEIPITYSTVVVDEEMFSEAEVTGPPSPPAPSASITGQMGALTGGSSAAAIPIAGLAQASASPPSGSATPPPTPPRVALTPAASSPAISVSGHAPPPQHAPHAPQAPSAFGTAPGHAPPPTQVASPLMAAQPQPQALAGQPPAGQHASPPATPYPPSGSQAAPAPSLPSTPPGGMTFSGLVSSGMTSAGVSLPVAPLTPAAAAPAAPPPAPPSAVTSSATGIPIAIGASPSSAAIAVPSTASQIATAATVPVSAPAAHDGPAPSAHSIPAAPAAPSIPAAHHDEPPPPPRIAKGRAQTLALSEDDLEEFLEENRLEARNRNADRQTSTSEELGDLDVEVEVDSAAVPAPLDDRAAWKSERVIVSPSAIVPERRSERSIASSASGEAAAAEQGDRRERLATPLGVPVSSASSPDLGRTKSASVPPPMPAAGHPPAAPASAPSSAAALAAAAASASSSPAISIPAAPLAPGGGGLSSPSLTPPPAGSPGRATPPPSPTKPPPAPPKKSDKRAAAVAAASQGGEQDKKPRSKAWFADVFDEDYLRTLPFLTPQATQAEAELVAASLGTSPGAKLLDVGCGYGRHAMELAARGYHVVGLDLSTPLLVRGGEEAHRRGLTINFIRGDMRELDFDGQFDGAYCLFSTFGYFDDETNKKTAGNIARALRPGGKCVFEILNRDYVIADLPTRVWWEGDGCVVLEEVDFNYFSSRICVNRSVVFDDGRQLEQEISIRAYSLHEVGKLMLAAGFRVLEVSGSYQTRGRFFGNQSRHIIVVAERTG